MGLPGLFNCLHILPSLALRQGYPHVNSKREYLLSLSPIELEVAVKEPA